MRKRYKDKRSACPLCKPHKRRWALRWKFRDLELIKRTDKEIESAIRPR